MSYDLMLFFIEFTLQDFYRIISYRIYSYKSNMCVGFFLYIIYILHNLYANPMNKKTIKNGY
jgi:hypothetical protein